MSSAPLTSSDLDGQLPYNFYEFFSGGGMARLGLGDHWKCLFSNDYDAKKVATYRRNFHPADELHHGDIANLTSSDLPRDATLAWASFPCQDLSLAGNGKGLAGSRSGFFWTFWQLMQQLKVEARRPPIIALENVIGLITSNDGRDLQALIEAFSVENYRVGAVVLDGAFFVAQSRPRLFLVAVDKSVEVPPSITSQSAHDIWHPKKLRALVAQLPVEFKKDWIWWDFPVPLAAPPHLDDIVEKNPVGVEWHSEEETQRILAMMSPNNLEKVLAAKTSNEQVYGTAYKRTRQGLQRLEVRFDGVSGCLRTPSGGSSRQIIISIKGNVIKSRLISPRETARLMGLPENYELPTKYNDAYHLTGDGLVVPAVAWLEQHILTPLATEAHKRSKRGRRKLKAPLSQLEVFAG